MTAGAGIGVEVRRAAEAEGIAPEGPLGRLVEKLAELGERIAAEAHRAEAAVEARVRTLDLAREGAEAAAEEARLAVADHKAQADRALVDLVDGLKEEVGAGIKDVLVIKQRVVGAQRVGLVAGLGAAAAVAVFLVGAGTMAWRDASAVRFHAACVQEIVRDAHGNAYCPLRGMPAEEGDG